MQIGEVELLGVSSSSTSASTYADTFNIQLDDAAAGTITFDGTSSFTGSAALSAGTSRNIVVNGRVSTANGALRLSANQQATSTASFTAEAAPSVARPKQPTRTAERR